MGWIKALAIGAAVIVVISMVSVVLHFAYLIILAVAIGAAVALVLKARARLRAGQDKRAKKVEAEQTRSTTSQRQLDVRAQAVQRQRVVGDELARLPQRIELAGSRSLSTEGGQVSMFLCPQATAGWRAAPGLPAEHGQVSADVDGAVAKCASLSRRRVPPDATTTSVSPVAPRRAGRPRAACRPTGTSRGEPATSLAGILAPAGRSMMCRACWPG